MEKGKANAGDNPFVSSLDEKSDNKRISQKNDNRFAKMLALTVSAGVLIIIVLSLVLIGTLIYKKQVETPVVRAVARVVPFPVAMVDTRILRYSDYLSDLDILRTFNQKTDNLIAEEKLKKGILDKMVFETLLQRGIDKYGITISDQEKEEYLLELGANIDFGKNLPEIEASVQEFFGISLDDYMEKAILPQMRQIKLAQALEEDPELRKEAREEAEDVLQKLKTNEIRFSEAVAQYSDDYNTVPEGGKIGTVGRSIFPENFEKEAYNLTEEGELSKVVEEDYGYHIIRLDKRINEGDKEVVEVSHILFLVKTLDEYIEEEKNSSKIRYFVDF